jgi:hypothetical protein
VDIYRHIATAGAASSMLLVCAAGPTLSLHSFRQQVDVVPKSECCKHMFQMF